MRRAWVAACALILAACGSETSEVLKEVRGNLRDPDSAKFRNVTIVDAETQIADSPDKAKWRSVCGEVNAKNAMGGYTGFSPFFSIIRAETGGAVVDAESAGRHIYFVKDDSGPEALSTRQMYQRLCLTPVSHK